MVRERTLGANGNPLFSDVNDWHTSTDPDGNHASHLGGLKDAENLNRRISARISLVRVLNTCCVQVPYDSRFPKGSTVKQAPLPN